MMANPYNLFEMADCRCCYISAMYFFVAFVTGLYSGIFAQAYDPHVTSPCYIIPFWIVFIVTLLASMHFWKGKVFYMMSIVWLLIVSVCLVFFLACGNAEVCGCCGTSIKAVTVLVYILLILLPWMKICELELMSNDITKNDERQR
jgi:hypothetical protein